MSEQIKTAETDRLQGRIGQLEGNLREALKMLDAAVASAAQFKPGDEVEIQKGRDSWVPAIVRRAHREWGTTIIYYVSERKKNGEWMDREGRAWNGIRKPVEVPDE